MGRQSRSCCEETEGGRMRLWSLLLALMALPSLGENDFRQAREAHKRRVAELYEQHRAACAENPYLWARSGILADRRGRTVTLYGESTRLAPEDPVEFFLIAEPSAKDYEALIVVFASAGDVREALQAIGFSPGRPVQFSALCFWPKGERMVGTVAWTNEQGHRCEARLEDLVWDRRTQRPLERTGLVYVGSRMVPAPDGSGRPVLAADAYDPYSIASTYNESDTLFDVPRAAVQGEVYRHQVSNPHLRIPPYTWVEVTLQPEYTEGRKRVVELDLELLPRPGVAERRLADIEWEIRRADHCPVGDRTMSGTLSAWAEMTAQGQDPFVSVRFSNDLTLGELREIARILASVEGERGIRVEPPPEGQLYFKAFLPEERFRRREDRILQPWELHLDLQESGVSARLVQLREKGFGEDGRPVLDVEEIPLSEPGQLRRELTARGPGLSAILVYAPPKVRYGALMAYLGPVLKTHPHIHVYPVEESGAAP